MRASKVDYVGWEGQRESVEVLYFEVCVVTDFALDGVDCLAHVDILDDR